MDDAGRNGVGGYGFLLSAVDADQDTNDPFEVDRFRIKIWNTATGVVVYDNQTCGDAGDSAVPCTEIGAGQIRVEKK